MKLAIKTVTLQEMINRAIKGAGMNKLIPLTSLMAIQVKENQLTIITTDASNTLYLMNQIEGDDFYCVVQVNQFSKLIGRMTSENITLELDGSVLTVIGNGTYKIELPLDENGEMIQYPDPASELKFDGEVKDINLATIKTILNTNKASLAITMEQPEYTGYYLGERVITTDGYKICGLDVKLFDEPVLISPSMMNLLDVMTEEKIGVYMQDDVIEFITKDCILYGYKMEGLEYFAVEPITKLLDEKFNSSCKINKNDFLALLDRILLFVGVYDNRAITLTFTKEGIDISSKQSNGVETLKYIENKGFKPYTCILDIAMLIQQVKANTSESFELQYGNEQSIKFVDDKVTQIVALLDLES